MTSCIKCDRCGQKYDPSTQSSFCRKHLRHYPTVPVEMPKFKAAKVENKPERKPFQGDLRLFWNEDHLLSSGINNPKPETKRRRR